MKRFRPLATVFALFLSALSVGAAFGDCADHGDTCATKGCTGCGPVADTDCVNHPPVNGSQAICCYDVNRYSGCTCTSPATDTFCSTQTSVQLVLGACPCS